MLLTFIYLNKLNIDFKIEYISYKIRIKRKNL
jgi:hypothetical protein